MINMANHVHRRLKQPVFLRPRRLKKRRDIIMAEIKRVGKY